MERHSTPMTLPRYMADEPCRSRVAHWLVTRAVPDPTADRKGASGVPAGLRIDAG